MAELRIEQEKIVQLKRFTNVDSIFPEVYTIDTLQSSSKLPLSANQGRILGEAIEELRVSIGSLYEDIGSLERDIDNKVSKIPGKGLSSNDFTNEYESILSNPWDEDIE